MTDANKLRAASRSAPEPTTPDPIEIAMEAEANDAGGEDSPARRVLLRHEQLLGWQIMKERAGFGLRVLTGIVGAVAAVLVGSLVWSASQERGLVIEPFSVPPEFAERGVTGQVVASRLLDRLSEMSDQTQSIRAPSTYANNWNGDIKVQIPQTGVSVGELRRYLVEWLGHQTTIGGELYQTPDGLSLIARTGTATATPETGTDERALDAMIQAAAEQVYAATQPYRYAIYLRRRGDAEGGAASEAALRELVRTGDRADQMWAHAALNLRLQELDDAEGAVREADAALALDPKFNLAYANRSGAYALLGRDEASYLGLVQAAATARSDGRRFMRAEGLKFVQLSWEAYASQQRADFPSALEGVHKAIDARAEDSSSLYYLMAIEVAMHDPVDAREAYARLPRPPADASPEARAAFALDTAIFEAGLSFDAQDWRRVVRLVGGSARAGLAQGAPRGWRITNYPYLAIALARMGDIKRARLVIAGTPTNCYRCVIARSVIAEASGDRATADRWFAEAVSQAPSLPFAHEEWGRAKLARGDLDGAEADFREANRRSPNWADPLKGLGDIQIVRGDNRGAVRQYDAAQQRAPQWTTLRQALKRARGA